MKVKAKPTHVWMGWIGTACALTIYGLFAAGIASSFWFFATGTVASVFLTWALYKDKAYYGAVLQGMFILLNILGALRIAWGS